MLCTPHRLYTRALKAAIASSSCAEAAAGPVSSLHCPAMECCLQDVRLCRLMSDEELIGKTLMRPFETHGSTAEQAVEQ